MWIFAQKGFLSIVKDRESDRLLVRGRFKGDIEALFPDALVAETEVADYRYRSLIDRDEVAIALAKQIRDIDYPNFKAAIKDHARHTAYTGVWGVMARAQDRQHGVFHIDGPAQCELELWPDDEPELFEHGPFYVPGEDEET
jgi:hypothetical protein